jgi:hypothetical protein
VMPAHLLHQVGRQDVFGVDVLHTLPPFRPAACRKSTSDTTASC